MGLAYGRSSLCSGMGRIFLVSSDIQKIMKPHTCISNGKGRCKICGRFMKREPDVPPLTRTITLSGTFELNEDKTHFVLPPVLPLQRYPEQEKDDALTILRRIINRYFPR